MDFAFTDTQGNQGVTKVKKSPKRPLTKGIGNLG